MKIISEKDIIIDVATGEVKVAQAPAYLQCLDLGSCVAVILWDEERKIGGIAHIMLPSSIQILTKDVKDGESLKYANHAIDELLKQMRELGASKEALIAHLVGGANVLSGTGDIGKENIEAIQKILQELGIRIMSQNIGGNAGRAVLFDVASGELKIDGKVTFIEAARHSSQEKKSLDKGILNETRELGNQVEQFNDVHKATINILEDFENKSKELASRVEELTRARHATANLLDDLTHERAQLVKKKAEDEALLTSIGDGIIAVDLERKIILINKEAEKLLGLTMGEVIGKLYDDIVLLQDIRGSFISPEKRPINNALSGTTTTTTTLYVLSKNKIKFPVSITVSPIILNNKIIGAVEAFRDITKELEIAKSKTDFVSLVSHQLRTPLTVVSWYIEIFLSGDIGEVTSHQKKYLEQVYWGNKRMVALVNALLDVSRIELGTLKVELKPTDIIQLARKIINDQKLIIEQKKLVVLNNFDEGIPILALDSKLLEVIFQNLLANAVEYTPPLGKIEFLISYDGKNTILIKISDTGVGIPKNQQDKIFTKLFRADNVREKAMGGIGFGLYIVKSIVENFGGKIWFESPVPGRPENDKNPGTVFYVEFYLDKMTNKEWSISKSQ